MRDGYFLKDTALIDKNNDAFHHEDYVKNLKTIIEEHEPPYNIALIGKWGVGKSSIINLLKEELKGKEEFVTHEINAWKYENDSLKKAFLKNLYQKLNPNADVSLMEKFKETFRKTHLLGRTFEKTNTVKETIKEMLPLLSILFVLFFFSSIGCLAIFYLFDITKALFTPDTIAESVKGTFSTFQENLWIPFIISPIYLMFKDFLKSSMQTKMGELNIIKPIETADEYEELFKKEIEKYKITHPNFKKLVVIVDDLDRLSPKKVVSALDAIKAFVDVKECIFIVACDESILINAIEKEKLKDQSDDLDGELFLDKLFHFRIPLPPIIDNDMTQYALDLCKQEAKGLVNISNGHFEEIIDILIHTEVSTPRQVKKLINTFANNLLIAKSREDNSRKLEQELLTGEKGIKFLAKLSVLQADYNEIYYNLSKDFTYLDDLLQVYLGDIQDFKSIKTSIKMIFNQKDSLLNVKPQYEGLLNFLIRTQHITVDNLSPYIYLAQDAIGLKAGDENQRSIRKSLVSGNERGIISLLEKGENKGNIELAIIGEIKNSLKKDLPSVIKAAIQSIKYISEEKKEFSNAISYMLTTADLSNIRFWQIEYKNIMETYKYADNKRGIEKALLFIIDNLFYRREYWKNNLGKKMTGDDFDHQTTMLLHALLDSNDVLPIVVKEKLKEFIAAEQEDFEVFPFSKIHQLYGDYKELFWEYFGLSFYKQLIGDIENENEEYGAEVQTLIEISPMIIESYSEEYIKFLPSILALLSQKNSLKMLKYLLPIIDAVSVESGTKIVGEIMSLKLRNSEEILEVLNILKQIKFQLNNSKELIEKFDKFLQYHLPQENGELMREYSELIEKVIQEEEDFELFNNVFTRIVENVLEDYVYDDFLKQFDVFLTDSQRGILFSKINSILGAYGYDSSKFERAYTLYSILKEVEENHSFIKQKMHEWVNIFINNQWSSYRTWANDIVKLFTIAGDLIEDTTLTNFIDALMRNVTNSDPELTIKALLSIGKNVPGAKVTECINHVMKYANTDTAKLDALEFLKLCEKHITNENKTLSTYTDFLIENLQLKVDRFLSALNSKLGKISIEKYIKLILNISLLRDEVFNLNIDRIKMNIEKFHSKYELEQKIEVLFKLIESDIYEGDIYRCHLNLINNTVAKNVLQQVIISDKEKDANFKMKLLKLSSHYQQLLDKGNVTNLIIDLFREKDDDFIIEICEILLQDYNSFRFGREKRYFSAQIIPSFRNANMEAKEKLLEIAKLFLIEKEFEQALKDNLFSDKEKELVIDKFNFQRRRLFNKV